MRLSFVLRSLALTVNDGSTTNNLVQITNASSESQGDAVVRLEVVNDNTVLRADQTGTSGLFAFRSAWYASDLIATSGVYTVTADFQPAADFDANRGGVIGWLSLASSNGVALQVVPFDLLNLSITRFRVSVVDFSADDANANDSFNHLFDTNGTAASGAYGSALSPADPNYSTTNFARFQLSFEAPSAADITALSNATAHIIARVFQGTNGGGAPIQVSQTIELLTDLPLPAAIFHRFGYFAVWGSSFDPGDVIGYLDNLNAVGGVGALPNTLPTVSITSPASGETFTAPANVPINVKAEDDGAVARVDFFAGATFLGTATNNPFGLTWSNVLAGSYSLTAQATDDRGGIATSSPVNITVIASTGAGPTLTITRAGNSVEISWPTNGYQLQMKINLSSQTWTDVPNTVNNNHATVQITSDNMFFRLVQASAPGGPKLAIQLMGDSVVISWPAQPAGYRLQAKGTLADATWADIATANNQYTEILASHPTRFYRLISP